MAVEVSLVTPPDDSGSDAFRRFCYQAHIAFRFCLNCALGGDVVSVVAEHIEDIAVERPSTWQFIQVKTRNADRGPWRLTDIASTDGALHSALRSHRALGNAPATIEIFLEGALKAGDDIALLRHSNGNDLQHLTKTIQRRLSIDSAECSELLGRLRLVADLPSREAIIDQNIRILGNQAKHVPFGVLRGIYECVLGKVFDAMALELLEPSWFTAIFNPSSASDEAFRTFKAKRLDRATLQPLVVPLTAPAQTLLRRIVEPSTDSPTILEQKLLAGGASQTLVSNAKSLRANATIAEFEHAASSIWDTEEQLENVRERLRIRANALTDFYADNHRPATQIWHELVTQLPQWANAIDANGIFHRDPDLLLGEICEMADLCLVDWGVSNAN